MSRASAVCSVCSKTISRKSHLFRHLRNVHGENPSIPLPMSWKNCLACDRPMRSARALKKDYPNTVVHGHQGMCKYCHRRALVRQGTHRNLDCARCSRPLRPRGVLAREWPGTMAYAANGMCHTCWENVKRSKNAQYIPVDQRIDLTAAAQVRRLVEARYTGEQRKYMLDILGIGGDL